MWQLTALSCLYMHASVAYAHVFCGMYREIAQHDMRHRVTNAASNLTPSGVNEPFWQPRLYISMTMLSFANENHFFSYSNVYFDSPHRHQAWIVKSY